ncbi:MAG: glycosyltransferase [Cyclobacteriaceae bacterium]|nr:glycosyltransferase [Cyclobacteriaceae bacterium]
MLAVVLLFFLFYYILVSFLIQGWIKAGNPSSGSNRKSVISVIVPVRNEEANITTLLDDLFKQDYPMNQLEILVVDDYSEDETTQRVNHWKERHKDFPIRLLRLTTTSGKKQAITLGVEEAKGEIIITTDADCRVGPSWLSSVAACFEEGVQFVAGPVNLGSDGTLIGDMQQLEFASLVGSGAALLAQGIPVMCNGANLAYRKNAFREVGGFEGNEGIPSGDDEFMMRKIHRSFPGSLRFNLRKGSVVTSSPASSWKQFMNQRIRWAGKWNVQGIGFSGLLAVFLFLFHAIVIGLIPLSFAGLIAWPVAIVLLLGKVLLEGIFLVRVQKFFSNSFSLPSFFMLQVVYPLYVIFFGLTANFLQAEWKGRRV